MKKPTVGKTGKLRALAEDPELGANEFDKLQQQYDNASIGERERLWPHFIRAIRDRYPGFLEEYERAFRNGEYLKAMFDGCMKRVLTRHDLSAGRKTNAQEDATAFMWAFKELQREDLGPKEMRELGYELAIRGLFTGLRAGLTPGEVEGLHARFMSDRQRKLGRTPKKEKPWRAYARMLFALIPEKDRALSNDRVAGKLWGMWAKETPAEWTEAKPTRPSFRTLTSFVGELRPRD
jgi:hypothetical protein